MDLNEVDFLRVENILSNSLDAIVFDDFYAEKNIMFERQNDENQQASLRDPLHVSVGPITRVRSKMINEALSGLIQEIWASSKTRHSMFGPKEDEDVINLIQAIDGADLA